MAIVEDGPGGGPTKAPTLVDWSLIVKYILSLITATVTTATPGGPSIQKAAPSIAKSETIAMSDQVAGKVGPIVGEYDSERISRMIEEF